MQAKSAFIRTEQDQLLADLKIVKGRHLRKPAALPHLQKSVYWSALSSLRPQLGRPPTYLLRYTLSLYYLTELKSERGSRVAGKAFASLKAIRKYTNQLAERCWEISIEANGSDDILWVCVKAHWRC